MARMPMLLLLLLGWSVANAAQPALLWTAKGFAQPESALYVAAEQAIFVSNLDGDAASKDGKGFISRLSADGKVEQLHWLDGLDAPKGLAYAQGHLFVADIDQLVEIDVRSASVVHRYAAPGAKLLNDIALEPRSHFQNQTVRAYVSDTGGNGIWYLADGRFSLLYQDAALEGPNGLLVEGDTLRVASWGQPVEGQPWPKPGRLKSIDIAGDGAVTDRFGPEPLGNLDGLLADGKSGYWLSDWVAGRVYHVAADGLPQIWLQAEQGTADIGAIGGKALLVPMMMSGELRAYALPR